MTATNPGSSANVREETDSFGPIEVAADKYWGAQTERSRNNFKIGPEASMPKEIIYAFGYLAMAGAIFGVAGARGGLQLGGDRRALRACCCARSCRATGTG